MRSFLLMWHLFVLVQRSHANIELEFYDNNNLLDSQDFSIKFPLTGIREVQSIQIVKDGIVIIDKTIVEIGKGLDLDIDGKYLDVGENKLEVLFISASGWAVYS